MSTNPLVAVTVKLEREDVELLDRLAKLEGLNRSTELRAMLAQVRPMIRQTVEAFEAAQRARDALEVGYLEVKVPAALQELLPEVERVQDAYMGLVSRVEGLSAAASARGGDAPASNTGATDGE